MCCNDLTDHAECINKNPGASDGPCKPGQIFYNGWCCNKKVTHEKSFLSPAHTDAEDCTKAPDEWWLHR